MRKDYLSSLCGSEDLKSVNFSVDGVVREAFQLFLTEQAEHLMFADINEQNMARANLESIADCHPEYEPLIDSIVRLCKNPDADLVDLKIKQAGAIYVGDFMEARELQNEMVCVEDELKQSILATLIYFPKFESEYRSDFNQVDFMTKKRTFEYCRLKSNQN